MQTFNYAFKTTQQKDLIVLFTIQLMETVHLGGFMSLI